MLDPSDVVVSEEVDKVSYWSSRFGTEMTINSVSKERQCPLRPTGPHNSWMMSCQAFKLFKCL